jgi:hypothetical protein
MTRVPVFGESSPQTPAKYVIVPKYDLEVVSLVKDPKAKQARTCQTTNPERLDFGVGTLSRGASLAGIPLQLQLSDADTVAM